MKQTKLIKTVLVAVVALVLILAFVACGKTADKNADSNNNNAGGNNIGSNDDGPNVDLELSDEMKELVENSRADIDAAFNYFLTVAEDNGEAQLDICFYNFKLLKAIRITASSGTEQFEVDVYPYDQTEQEDHDGAQAQNDEITEKNKRIYNPEIYQKALNCKRPTQITKFNEQQLQFMESNLHRGAYKKEIMAMAYFFYSESELARMEIITEIGNVNIYIQEGIFPYGEDTKAGIEAVKKFMENNYTDDSYINVDEESGCYTYKLKYKVGWHIEEISEYDSESKEFVYNDTYAARYYYENVPSTLTVPTQIAGYDIKEAELYPNFSYDTIESLMIEKAMDRVDLYANIKQIYIPVSEKPFVHLYGNAALETINFGGTMEEWNKLYGQSGTSDSADSWTHVEYFDDMEGKDVKKDITFTVVCTNGSITYPQS